MRSRILILSILLAMPLFTSCEFLDQAAQSIQKPTLTYQEALLVQSPTTTSLLAYYCPSVMGATLCSPVLGAAPAKEDLRFDFELNFRVDNPTALPIPTLSMLLATTLFENDPNVQELGATCVTFCDPDDPSCTGNGAEDACASNDQNDIDTWDDFASSATDQLVGVATGELDAAYGDNLGIRTIPAHGFQDMKVVFSLGLDPMTNILGRVSNDYVTAYMNGNEEPVEIPYNVRGTLWVDVPANIGRVGLPFGPQSSVWQLD